MCVIIIKPRGKRLPPMSVLKKAWDSNSHGAGYAINRKKDPMTKVQKGFMDFEAFAKALSEEEIRKNDVVLLHFRIKTHGHTNAAQTQPFPISTQREDLERLAYRCNMICAHNGIFSLSGQPDDISDTMYYIKDWASQLDLTALKNKESPAYQELETDCQWSKLAFIVNGSVHLFGNWAKHQGCYYSNLHSVGVYKSTNNASIPSHVPSSLTEPYHRSHYHHRRDAELESDYYGGWIKDY